MARRTLAGLVAVVATIAGCTVEVTFSPLGSDVSVDGSWTINGMTPSAANCSAAGIETVGMVFWDGGLAYDFAEFEFACADGSFDTRPDKVLAYGSYQTQWVAYNAAGVQIATGPMIDLVVNAPIGHASLLPADFVSGTPAFNPRGTDFELTGDWTIDGATPDATNCAAVGISRVALVFYDQSDTSLTNGVVMGEAGCATGKFDSMPMKIGAYGAYLTTYRALASDGASLGESMALPLTVAAPTGRAMLATVNFESALTLNVTVSWDTTVGPTMTDATCADAGVAVMNYQLTNSATMTNIDMANDIACADSLSWTDADGLVPATYHLYLEGGTVMRKSWMATCDMLIVEAGVEMYNCFVDKVE